MYSKPMRRADGVDLVFELREVALAPPGKSALWSRRRVKSGRTRGFNKMAHPRFLATQLGPLPRPLPSIDAANSESGE